MSVAGKALLNRAETLISQEDGGSGSPGGPQAAGRAWAPALQLVRAEYAGGRRHREEGRG